MGRPFAFLEEESHKLYFVKHRKWFYFDENISLKNGFFSYDSKNKQFFLLKCEINVHLIVHKYMYFNIDSKNRTLTPGVTKTKYKMHNPQNMGPENIIIGSERFKMMDSEFFDFEVDKDMSLIFMVIDSFVLV